MSQLEDSINDALARGEFVHLSVISDGNQFRATFASASRAGGYAFGVGKTPQLAMIAAIKDAPMKRKVIGSARTAPFLDDEALG